MSKLDYSTLLRGCYFPYVPKDNPNAKFSCGKCPNCIKRRVDGWAFRIMYHLRYVKHAYFVTLTYMDGTIDRTPNGFLTLNKEHVQKYFKRLRKALKQTKDTPFNEQLKYIVTGEYGSNRGRPHYHIILMNVPAETIMEHWPYGIVDLKEVVVDRIAYCFKYVQKPRKRKMDTHSRDDRQAEYLDFSQGLGKQWLTDTNIHFHKRNIANPTLLFKASRIAIPAYYKNRIFDDDEKKQIAAQMESLHQPLRLTDSEAHDLHMYKNEKLRIMHTKSKKDKL